MTPLRRRLIERMTVQNLAPTTRVTYVQQARCLHATSASHQTPVLRRFADTRFTWRWKRHFAPSSINTAVAALRFLYNVTLQKHWVLEEIIPAPKISDTLPIVLSPEEVLQFLECVKHIKHRTILTACYAAGLRISEAVH